MCGKFVCVGGRTLPLKGVTYGTFAPDANGAQFPSADIVAADFAKMAECGINMVRTYTTPSREILDEAARHGLRMMIGVPWTQHVAFLGDRKLTRSIREDVTARVAALADHPAALLFAIGNEIPPSVVRWHGARRVQKFLRALYADVKAVAPDALITYVNFPPTDYLDLSFFDVCAFNVYLHREADLRSYVRRLQNIAGSRPLLLAEAGADSIREGVDGQAELTAMQLRVAFSEGACGAVAFAWTDEWWRGGFDVQDWAFGLVDRDRQPKPALDAVAQVFESAPFSPEEQRSWPKVSVVVCAYNASDTLDECLRSLAELTYPDFEVLVINDGSTDATGAIARQHPWVRLIETPNFGLSAARNLGLAEAKGEIVAYTDADVRVTQEWLTFLVQPFLRSDVVGAGGPNVVPEDDHWMAQCVARAPGSPTHVLLDDFVAEHVPGCNMAFRRDALLAIGGFNPVYLRAGDDVDLCWRLQARGWKIGFAPSALVWHRHRSTMRAYWRQQIGYGEGEVWLAPHHPDKFVGGHMLWRGHIYSPLPFIRSLSGTRVNAGVWGSAPFPSVYRTEVRTLAFLPHSDAWMLTSFLLTIAGLGVSATSLLSIGILLLLLGLGGFGFTLARCVMHAFRSPVEKLHPIGRLSPRASRALYRLTIAWLHVIQPLARLRGRIRGFMNTPDVDPELDVTARRSPGRVPGVSDLVRAARLIGGTGVQEQFWSERWTNGIALLDRLTQQLRTHCGWASVNIDEGWRPDRDITVEAGRVARLDLRVLVEEHSGGRCLTRVATSLRLTAIGWAVGILIALGLAVLAEMQLERFWPMASVIASILGLFWFTTVVWRAARVVGAVKSALADVMERFELVPVVTESPLSLSPRSLAWLRVSALAGLVALSTWSAVSLIENLSRTRVEPPIKSGARPIFQTMQAPGGIAVAPNGDLYVADPDEDVIERIDRRGVITTVVGSERIQTAPNAGFDTPGGVAVASNGDLVIADTHNHRIVRVDKLTGAIRTIAGTGRAGFTGDGGPATLAQLSDPSAIAVAANEDLYIADSSNDRIRRIDHATGVITTIAGGSYPTDDDQWVGDNGPATQARLNGPSDVAIGPDGSLYVADTHDNRVRRIDRAGIITTIAGNGTFGSQGDGGAATSASLAGPAGIAIVPEGDGISLYIADFYNGRVRVVHPSGVIEALRGSPPSQFGAPSRIAYNPRGWLYVTDASRDVVTAVAIPPQVVHPTARVRKMPIPLRPTDKMIHPASVVAPTGRTS